MTEIRITANKNGRIYPRDVLHKAVDDAQERVRGRRLIGEMGNPADGKSRISQASHVVTDLRVDARGRVVADLEFLDTAAGKHLKAMFDRGVGPIGGSLRGVGSVDANGVVGPDYKLTGVDVLPGFPEEEPDAVTQLGDVARDDASASG